MNDHDIARLLARRAAQADTAEHVARTPIRDPRGGLTTVADALLHMQRTRHEIDESIAAGSQYHRRITPAQRCFVQLLPALDGLILLWFLAGVLNVDLTRFDLTLAIAAALATLCTISVAAWNAAVGQHLQRSKDRRSGDLVWDHMDASSWTLLGLSIVMAVLLGVLMDVRVNDEIYQATGQPGSPVAITALTLAAATVLMNLAVLYLSYRDGSPVTRELEQLGHALQPHLGREHRAHARARATDRRLRIRVAAHQRTASPTPPPEIGHER